MIFDPELHKSVIVVNKNLPLGLAINAVCVIGASFGKIFGNAVGHDISSLDNVVYPGLVRSPLPILKASQLILNEIQQVLSKDEEIILLPFSNLAQSCKSYEEYEKKLSATHSSDLPLSCLGIIGPQKKVNKATGNFPLYK